MPENNSKLLYGDTCGYISTTAGQIQGKNMEAQLIKSSYPFVQYRDDLNTVAFFEACNEIAQEYLGELSSLSMQYCPSPAL